MINTVTWDAADHLQTKEAIIAYLEAALEDGDSCIINAALADIARSQAMAQIVPAIEPGPEIIGQASLNPHELDLANLTKILQILGLRLQIVDINQEKSTFPSVVA